MLKKLAIAISVLVAPQAYAHDYLTIDRPHQECWYEEAPSYSGDSYAGAIIGGIAGGILGHQVGGGKGKTVATAVGAVTGAVVGDRLDNRRAVSYHEVRRCRTVVERVTAPVPVVEAVVYVTDDDDYWHDDYKYNHKHKHKHRRHHHHGDDD